MKAKTNIEQNKLKKYQFDGRDERAQHCIKIIYDTIVCKLRRIQSRAVPIDRIRQRTNPKNLGRRQEDKFCAQNQNLGALLSH